MKEKKWSAPQWVLLCVSAFAFLLTPVIVIFTNAKSGDIKSQWVSIPFWPFTLALAFLLNPFVHDLFKAWLKMKVDVAKAENQTKDTETK